MFARHVSSLVILNNVNKKLCRNQDSNLGYYGTVVRCDPQRRVLTTRRLRLTYFKHFLQKNQQIRISIFCTCNHSRLWHRPTLSIFCRHSSKVHLMKVKLTLIDKNYSLILHLLRCCAKMTSHSLILESLL